MSKWPYKSGQWLVVCDTCGRRFYSSQCQKDSDGFIVCKSCFDPKHPQEDIRPIRERITVPDPRPEGTDTFLSPGDITPDDL